MAEESVARLVTKQQGHNSLKNNRFSLCSFSKWLTNVPIHYREAGLCFLIVPRFITEPKQCKRSKGVITCIKTTRSGRAKYLHPQPGRQQFRVAYITHHYSFRGSDVGGGANLACYLQATVAVHLKGRLFVFHKQWARLFNDLDWSNF